MRASSPIAAAFIATALMTPNPVVAQETKLTFATLSPPGSPGTVTVYRPWAQRVEAKAGGSLKVEFSEGYALANFTNALDRLINDVIQITNIVPSNYAGKFPLTEVGNLPFTADNAETAGAALWRLYKAGLLNKELAEFVPFAFYTFGTSGIHLAKKPPRALEDLRGLRIAVASRIQGQTITNLGGAPLVIMPQDVYESLNRGLSDGIITSWNTFNIWKYGEVTSYHVDTQFGTAVAMLTMTRKRYEALPQTARNAIDESADESTSRRAGAVQDEANVSNRAAVATTKDQTIVAMTPEQNAAWRQKTASILDEWAGGREGGTAVLGAYRKFLTEVQAR